MSLTYKLISGFYDLIDVIYFKEKGINPRKAIAEYIPNKKVKVLDICTGTGSNGIIIGKEKTKAEIIGIDRSKDMLKIANSKIEKTGIKNMKTIYGDAGDTHLDKDSFDVIIIALVLHEISKDLAERIIKEAKRLLKSEGRILILEWEQPSSFIKKILFWLIKISEPKGFKEFLNKDKKEYFKEYGLEIKSLKHCDYSCVYELIK